MNKGVFIIPASGQLISKNEYQQIKRLFESKKITPILVQITWKRRIMTDYVREFMDIYEKEKDRFDEVYLFGFSFGAMISFICCDKIQPKKLILCSLSPWFKEDIPFIPKSYLKMSGTKMIEDLKNYRFKDIVSRIKTDTTLVIGNRENDLIKRRSIQANNNIKDSKLIRTQARHNISDKNYFNTIKDLIANL